MTSIALPVGAFTVDDLEAFPDDGHRYELYDGALVVTPSPIPLHQRVSANLFRALDGAAPPALEVLTAPLDWRISRTRQFQPDLLVVSRRAPGALGPRVIETPLLAVEILSPSTRLLDLGAKRRAYADAGLRHYWIVDPDADAPSITVLRLSPAGEYDVAAAGQGDEPVAVADPFTVSVVPADLVR